jgi:hypothetical protein
MTAYVVPKILQKWRCVAARGSYGLCSLVEQVLCKEHKTFRIYLYRVR